MTRVLCDAECQYKTICSIDSKRPHCCLATIHVNEFKRCVEGFKGVEKKK